MAKTKKTKSTKKQIKNKNSVNVNIHIDQSKKTTGNNNPKRSNVKTLPAYSSAPSYGGNYVRQFTQDPYYTQSQYDNINLLKQYNNLVRQNNPMITNGNFRDNNINEQKLIQNMNGDSVIRSYKVNDDSASLDELGTLQENIIEFEMNDDPRTNKNPQNAILTDSKAQKLPLNDINTTKELKGYDEDADKKQLLLENDISDEIRKAMMSNDKYHNGYKIFRHEDIPANKYFNKNTGLFVNYTNIDYVKSQHEGKAKMNYTTDPYEINQLFKEVKGTEYENQRNTGWKKYKQKVSIEEHKADDEDEVMNLTMKQKPVYDDNKSNVSIFSAVGNFLTPKKDNDLESIIMKQKPTPKKGKVNKSTLILG